MGGNAKLSPHSRKTVGRKLFCMEKEIQTENNEMRNGRYADKSIETLTCD